MNTSATKPPSGSYLPFVDWLKTLGLALIVYGHVAARTSVFAVPPIAQKQLGVAFFVFATGFMLSRDHRLGWRSVYDRLFEIIAVGFAFALVMSAIGLLFWGDIQESNYLPFIVGLNVVHDYFPANPTTWYIGTYIHLLLFSTLVLRRIRITIPVIAAVAGAEILVRAVLMELAGRYVAYMFLGNWITVLTIGFWMGRRLNSKNAGIAGLEDARVPSRWLPAIAALTLFVGWPLVMGQVPWEPTFPFMIIRNGGPISALATSAAVSFVYISYTLVTYSLARTLPANAIVRMFARNTLFVVIVHMPVYYLLNLVLAGSPFVWRASIDFLVCFVGLTLLSELLQPYLALKRRREECLGAIERLVPGSWLRAPSVP